ncbi:MAG: YCF48-related protein [Pyrinomonadaceae bacterium]
MREKRFDASPRLLCVVAMILACVVSAQAGVWQRQQSGTMAWLHAVFFLDQSRGWAAGSNGALMRTTDGGATWQAARRPTEDALQDIAFVDAQNGWMVCDRSIYLLRTKDEQRTYLMSTQDGGASWKRVDIKGLDVDSRLVRALFSNRERGWTFGEGGLLFATRDGGATWLRQRVPTRYLLLGGTFVDREAGWIVGAGATVLQTVDGGETWNSDIAVQRSAGVRFHAASFVDRRRGWVVGAKGLIFATVDGGRTWREQQSNTKADLFDVKFTDAREGWAVGDDGTIVHTVDGGAHWTIEPSGTTHKLERLYFTSRERGWAVGFGGTIIAYNSSPTSNPPSLRK